MELCVCVFVGGARFHISLLMNFFNLEKRQRQKCKYNLREVQSIVF